MGKDFSKIGLVPFNKDKEDKGDEILFNSDPTGYVASGVDSTYGGKGSSSGPTDSGWGGTVSELAQKLAGMSYDDFTKGEDYASLEERYSRQGRRAMDDTMGMAAARTGGLASSYAVAAGNQAYNDHMGKLEDAARALYDSQRAEIKDNLSIAQGMYDREYAEKNKAQADAQSQVMTILSQGGTLPRELIEATGWDTRTITAYKNYYKNAAAAGNTAELMDPTEMTKWWETIRMANADNIVTYINHLSNYDVDLALALFEQWADQSDENKAKYDETVAKWDAME